MTEEEWLICVDPARMLEFLRGKASDRPFRMFACDCVRRLWSARPEGTIPEELLLGERFAEGEVEQSEIVAAKKLLGARGGYSSAWAMNRSLWAILEFDAWTSANLARIAGRHYRWYLAEETDGDKVHESKVEERTQADRLREIFGNPFHPVIVEPNWLTSDVVSLARGIYADRAFDRLPILADALQDVGCDNDELLNHCRQRGEHVRGCWVVDRLLGRR